MSLLILLACAAGTSPARDASSGPGAAVAAGSAPVAAEAASGAVAGGVEASERAVLAERCATGDATACAGLGAAARRVWAESVVGAGLSGGRVDTEADQAARYLAWRACDLGDSLACRDVGPRGPWRGGQRPEDVADADSPPMTRAVTVVDEAGLPRVGLDVRVLRPPFVGPMALLYTDVRGQIRVPEGEVQLQVMDYLGRVEDRLVIPTGAPSGAAAGQIERPAVDPWAVPDPTPLLDGTWARRPNQLSDRSLPPLVDVHLDLPGATGGVTHAAPPPATLRFRVSGPGAVTLGGERATLTPGAGTLRLDRDGLDAWIMPVDPDTFVYRPADREAWRYPEVYRRED